MKTLVSKRCLVMFQVAVTLLSRKWLAQSAIYLDLKHARPQATADFTAMILMGRRDAASATKLQSSGRRSLLWNRRMK